MASFCCYSNILDDLHDIVASLRKDLAKRDQRIEELEDEIISGSSVTDSYEKALEYIQDLSRGFKEDQLRYECASISHEEYVECLQDTLEYILFKSNEALDHKL